MHGPAFGRKRVISGMPTLLFDPERLVDGVQFQQEMRRCIDWIKASQPPPQPGFDRVRVAGEPECEMRTHRLTNGHPG